MVRADCRMWLGTVALKGQWQYPKREEIETMKADTGAKPVVAEPANVEEEIRKRAYELFEARGREEGHEFEDWLRAEEEIRGRKTNAVAAYKDRE